MDIRKLIERKRAESDGHTGQVGIRYVAQGDNWAELALDYDPRLAISHSNGLLASGPIISLIDTASGGAIMASVERFRPFATLDIRIDYVRAAPPGKTIFARATCYRMTRNVAFVSCEAHDGKPDDLVARSLSSFCFTGD